MPHPNAIGRAIAGLTDQATGAAYGALVLATLMLATGLLGAGAGIAGLPGADTVSRLSGRWAGLGTVTLSRGPAESFKCVVTYLPAGEVNPVQQNLRCSNENYKLDAATHLQFDGAHVSGRWEDKIHNLDGTVSGALTADGFNILLAGRFFQATMDVTGDACALSVKVAPTKGAENIREIAAALRKC